MGPQKQTIFYILFALTPSPLSPFCLLEDRLRVTVGSPLFLLPSCPFALSPSPLCGVNQTEGKRERGREGWRPSPSPLPLPLCSKTGKRVRGEREKGAFKRRKGARKLRIRPHLSCLSTDFAAGKMGGGWCASQMEPQLFFIFGADIFSA